MKSRNATKNQIIAFAQLFGIDLSSVLEKLEKDELTLDDK